MAIRNNKDDKSFKRTIKNLTHHNGNTSTHNTYVQTKANTNVTNVVTNFIVY